MRTAERGQYEEAAELFTECIEKDPDGQNFWLFNKALMIHRLGRLEEATALFEDVYRSDPSNTQVCEGAARPACPVPTTYLASSHPTTSSTRLQHATSPTHRLHPPDKRNASPGLLAPWQ